MAKDKPTTPRLAKVDESELPLRVIGEEEAPYIYADSIDVVTSPFEFRLLLRQTVKGGHEQIREERIKRHLATLFLSPPHMKALAQLLQRNLEAYETTFGKIIDVNAPQSEPPKADE